MDDAIDLRLVPIYLKMSGFCKEDLKKIESPGWGYVGPYEAAEEQEEVGELTVYRTVADEEYIRIEDLFDAKHWESAPDSQVKEIMTNIKIGREYLDSCLAWIPSDLNAVLEAAVQLLQPWGLVQGISWDLKPEDNDCQIKIALTSGEELVGQGETILIAALDLYHKCWMEDYDLAEPSIVELSGDFDIYTNENGDSFMQFYDYQQTLQFMDDKFVRYNLSSARVMDDSGFKNIIGTFSFIEGEFTAILTTAIKRADPKVEKPF